MEVLAPPSCTAFVPMVFDEVKGRQFLQVMVQVVPVNAQCFLQLYGAHLFGLGQFNIGTTARRVSKSGGDGVAAHSSHSLTVWQERLLWFEDVVSNRIKFIQPLAGK